MVRDFRMQDAAEVCSILHACSASRWAAPIPPDAFRRALRSSPEWGEANGYISEMDGQVRGFGAVTVCGGDARIPYLHVHPGYRGRGIGGELLQQIEAFCEERGCASLSLGGFALRSPFHGVDARDSGAASFLKRRGYSEHFRAATRILQLPLCSSGIQDMGCRSTVYRFDLVSDSQPHYWEIRRGLVDLCHDAESRFAVFARTYDGRQIHKENAHIAAARQDQRVIGFAGFVPFQDVGIGYEAYPQWGPLLVHPSHRGEGIARRLLQMSLAEMAQLGCERAVVGGTGVAGPAAHLYESVGFETVVNWIEYWKEREEHREQSLPADAEDGAAEG